MPSRFTSLKFGAAAVALGLVSGISAAGATTITYTASGPSSDGALSASADFTTSAGQLTVTLTNTLSASVIRSPGQALSDISFTLSNPAGTVGTTTASGQLGNISSSGDTVTYTTGSPGRFLGVGGGKFSVSGDTILMEAIGGGQPSEMILPFVANGGAYPNLTPNGGLRNFNPSTVGPATFTLDLSGVTAGTTITAATFSFGTTPDHYVTGTTTPTPPVPEPSSLASMGFGLAALGLLLGWRRRRV